MGMSNAERQRKFRQNRDKDASKRQTYLNQEKERYQRDKKSGKKKNISNMTNREKRSTRKRWRTQKRKDRATEKQKSTVLTPPNSPGSDDEPQQEMSRQKSQSIQKKKKEMSKCYRDNNKLKQQICEQAKKIEMFRKRWYREKDKTKSSVMPDTPRTKTRKLLRNVSQKQVKKNLIFHYALMDQLKESYTKRLKKGEKRQMAKILSGSILRKYKMKTVALKQVGIDIRNQLKTRTSLSKRICKPVREFYERDDVSRVTTGIKQTITCKKVKKQRRVLTDTVTHLHMKYLTQPESPKVSLTTFCKLRPFWVVFPNDSDRSTCLCKLCENTQFMSVSLRKKDVIKTDNLESIVKEFACDIEKKDCMFGDCEECKSSRLEFNKDLEYEEIEWTEWALKTEKRKIKTGKSYQEKDISITVKELKRGSVDDLVDKFEDQLTRYKKHLFLIRNQYSYYRQKKQSLKEGECIVHIDFSENYICKMSSEIQSMHFGASKHQLSLHTGIYHIGNGSNQTTFCTVSENLNHGPPAIWAHLKPILKRIKDSNPEVSSIEFFSDGPTTQYRQKGNFYLACIEPQKLGFERVVWNFFEAGHGKGVPDAVGGAVKRNADSKVKYGQDIMSGKEFVNQMKTSEIFCCLITEKEILNMQQQFDKAKLKPLPGTMKLHQMFLSQDFNINYREISCNCKGQNECKGHETMQAQVSDEAFIKCAHNTKDCAKESKKRKAKDCSTQNKKGKIKKERVEKEPRKTEAGTRQHILEQLADNNNHYDKVLNSLKVCKSFSQLKAKCRQISTTFINLEQSPQLVSIMQHKMDVDADAMDVYPNDIPDDRALYPCTIKADGNCLPSCGSVFGHGSDKHSAEIRVRILTELVLNDDYYLDNTSLLKGTRIEGGNSNKHLPKIYAQYSDMYVPGMTLTDCMVKHIYQMEAMKIKKDKSYMGIWQIHALSSVLCCPIYSVYPKLGNPNVRLDLNRLIMPRNEDNHKKQPVYILWTSTRNKEMRNEHWVPNHFVPVLPIDVEIDVDMDVDKEEVSVVGKDLIEREQSEESENVLGGVQAESGERGEGFGVGDQNERDKSGEKLNIFSVRKDQKERNDSREKVNILDVGDDQTESEENGENGNMLDVAEDQKEREESGENGGMLDVGETQKEREESGENGDMLDVGEDQKEREESGENGDISDVGEDQKEREESGENGDISDVGEDQKEREESGENGDMLDVGEDQKEREESGENGDISDVGEDQKEREESGEKGNMFGYVEEQNARGESGEIVNWQNIPSPDLCVGKFVIVKYNGLPYPGYVEDAGQSDLYVECMHRIGKKGTNCFVWPKKIKDKCWYDFDNILAIIPEPKKIPESFSHFEIENEIWKSVTSQM